MDKNEYAKSVNSYVSEYVKFGDAKAGSVLGFIIALFGVMISLFSKVLPPLILSDTCHVIFFAIFVAIYVFFVVKTIIHSLNALSPKFNFASKSLNSFPDIATFDTGKEYSDEVTNLSENDFYVQFSKHNWILSKIAVAKFGEISKAIYNLKVSLFLSVGFSILYLCLSNIK